MTDEVRNILLGAVVLLCAIFVAHRAYAQSGQDRWRGHHGQGHAQHHDWYQDLKQPGTGFSCCNGDSVDANGNRREGDCRPTRAYRDDDGVWWVLIDGIWRSVPPRVVLDAELNLEPFQAHVCASKSGNIYCFLGKRAGG